MMPVHLVFAVVAVAVVHVTLAWMVVEWVLIPLGLARSAYVVTFLSVVVWRSDPRGIAMVACARAILRQSRRSAGAVAFLDRKLCETLRARGGALVAKGLSAAIHGDFETARDLMAGVDLLAEIVTPLVVRRTAVEWLVAEAASRGDWRTVLRVMEPPVAASRLARLVRCIAERLLGEPDAPGNEALVLRWLVAPRRRHSWTLVRRAMDAPPARPTAPALEVDDPTAGDLAAALALHARLASRDVRIEGIRITELASAWATALQRPETRRGVRARAQALGARDPDGALSRVEAEVENALAELALGARPPAADWSATELGRRAAARLRQNLLMNLELATQALSRRVREDDALGPIDEWREFSSIGDLYESVAILGDAPTARLAFRTLFDPLTRQAVWLYNARQERVIANGIFVWLAQEARTVGDDEAARLSRKNAQCKVW
jgi:hypothetical protein